ncbi:hypothetical protein FRB97_009171 [Tulasnella sp. 331]|nr:hypothetical protein FRB97_009171 [Tulasnella sp. 331]
MEAASSPKELFLPFRTPGYIQVIGLFNQTSINLDPTDPGGELDPHDDDQLGNPIGGMMYSTGSASSSATPATALPRTTAKTPMISLAASITCLRRTSRDYFWRAKVIFRRRLALTPQTELLSLGLNPASSPQPAPFLGDIPASSNCVTYQSTDLFPVSDLGYQNTAGVPPAAVTTATTTPHAAATDSAAESRSDSPSVAAPTTTTTSDSKSGSTSGALSATSSMSTGWLVVVLLDLRRCLIDAGVMPPGLFRRMFAFYFNKLSLYGHSL